MKLKTYLETHTAAELARELNITPVLISQWKSGSRLVPIKQCVAIERITNGQVTRKQLRPDDYWDIWPEIIDKRECK